MKADLPMDAQADETPGTSVVATGVRGYPHVPRDVRVAVGKVLGEAHVYGYRFAVVPIGLIEGLAEAVGAEVEIQDLRQSGLGVRLIPLPLHLDDDGREMTEAEADAYHSRQSGQS